MLQNEVVVTKRRKKKNKHGPLTLSIILVFLFAMSRFFGQANTLEALRNWIESFRLWGVVAYIAIYVLGAILGLPGSPFTLLAGPIFGPQLGILLVSIASTIGAACAFMIARYGFNPSWVRWIKKNEHFEKLNDMVRTKGAYVVALTRLIPLFPYALLNYGFGLTRVSFKTYLFWSWLCMLPSTIVYVIGGELFVEAVSTHHFSTDILVAFGISIVLMGSLVYLAKKKLDHH